MVRDLVKSSTIKAVGYDPQGMILEVEFHAGGIYEYYAVPADVCSDMRQAPSIGSFYAKIVKPKYKCLRIN